MNIEKSELQMLKEIYEILNPSPIKNMMNLVYLTQAEQLRRQANEIEERDKKVSEFKEWLDKKSRE